MITRRQSLKSLAMAPLALVSSKFGLATGVAADWAAGDQASSAANKPAAGHAPPNIVFIMADDLGYADVSCYGRREYVTPNIDKLAKQGVKFMQAYANSAVCTATRVALITGRYQYRLPVGLEEPLASPARNIGLPPSHPTMPSLLKQAGYGTTLVGKWHLGWLPDFSPLKSGYGHFYGFRGGALDYFTHKQGIANTDTDDLWDQDTLVHTHGYLTELLGDRAVSVIDDYAKAKQPFLLSLHFNAPHWPWEGPDDEAESRRVSALVDYDGGDLATYGRMVVAMDKQIGRVLEALDKNRLAENTIVVFTSDNGGERFSDTWPFTGKKMELLEGGLRIPAIARWPGHIKPGTTTEQVAISMDWVPTMLEASGGKADPAYPLDGMSLLANMTGKAAPVPRKLFWRFHANGQMAARDGDLKWLKIRENDFLFNVVADPLERAQLKVRQAADYMRIVAEYKAWDATMLPIDPNANTGFIKGSFRADHYGVD
jgi:arylsulfatase A-like enzyme